MFVQVSFSFQVHQFCLSRCADVLTAGSKSDGLIPEGDWTFKMMPSGGPCICGQSTTSKAAGFSKSLLVYLVETSVDIKTVCRHPGDKAQGDVGAGSPGRAVFSMNCEGGDTRGFCSHRGSAEILDSSSTTALRLLIANLSSSRYSQRNVGAAERLPDLLFHNPAAA